MNQGHTTDGAKGNEQTSGKSDIRIVDLRGRKGYATEKKTFFLYLLRKMYHKNRITGKYTVKTCNFEFSSQ